MFVLFLDKTMASSELWCLRSALMDVMNDLVDSDLETFKFYIQDPDLFREFSVIRRHQLETTERPKFLTAILDHYGIFTIDIVKTVLEKMSENTLRTELGNRCAYKPQGNTYLGKFEVLKIQNFK